MNLKKKKDEYFEETSRVFKLLGSPIKLKLLNYISFAPRTVEDCANKFNQSVQNISLHLISLAKEDILVVDKIKNYRFYSLSSNNIVQVITKAMLANPKSLLPPENQWNSSRDELVEAVKRNELVLVDLRDFDESNYIPVKRTHHYDGSLSKISEFLNTFAEDQELVFFCKGKMCERLAQAVQEAKRANFQVKGLALSASELSELSMMLN